MADFENSDAIKELAEKSDIITYEIESGNADALESVSNIAQISPSPDTLRTLQDKYIQKQFLHKHGVPVGEFSHVDSLEDVHAKAKEFGFPFLACVLGEGVFFFTFLVTVFFLTDFSPTGFFFTTDFFGFRAINR